MEIQSVFLEIAECPIPVIVALHGACIGAGLDLACLCDMRYGSNCCVVSSKEILLGVAPDLGSIPALGTQAWALAALFTGSDIPGHDIPWFFSAPLLETAQRALCAARSAARVVANANPRAIRLIKSVVHSNRNHKLASTLSTLARGNFALL